MYRFSKNLYMYCITCIVFLFIYTYKILVLWKGCVTALSLSIISHLVYPDDQLWLSNILRKVYWYYDWATEPPINPADCIVAMWRFTRNNGITEGFHNKMEMISRRAYGFRNFENYRIRVMTHCAMPVTGWDGVINRVRWVLIPRLWGRAEMCCRVSQIRL